MSGLAEETFRQIVTSKGPLLERILTSSLETRPPDAPSLAAALQCRPDVQAQLASVTGCTPSLWVLKHELDQVEARRAKVGVVPLAAAVSTANPYKRAATLGLMGLCFSGGGIRSATFNLGILQGLAELKLLGCFDYLSTVSGGGYIHQWFAAWSKRRGFEEVEKLLIPLPGEDNPGTHPEPLRWLRRYSNYLTPQTGVLSADTWVAIATWLRNALLNQIILISGLLFLVLLPHLLTFRVVIPQNGPAAVAIVGVIFYLSLVASYFIGKNLALFTSHDAGHKEAFGQRAVEGAIVLPLQASALLLTLLLRKMSATTFGFNLFLVFEGSTFLLLALALTIILGGGAPLSFLKSHQSTSQYKSVKEFWKKPKRFSHLKLVVVLLALFIAAFFAAVCGATWIVGSLVLIAKLWACTGPHWWRTVLILLPALILTGPLLTMLFLVGLLGRTFQEARREWLSRQAAWIGLYILGWIAFFGFSLFGHSIVLFFCHKLTAGIPVLVTWLTASVGGLLAGKSSNSSGAKSDKAPSKNWTELLAVIGPYVFVAGLIALISFLAEVVLKQAESAGPIAVILSYLLSLGICALFAWRVDINEFSMHAFYRNRLARCYLGASNLPRHPNPFTGFDDADAEVAVSDLLPAKGYNGPFPIFCTALNLTFGQDLAWQERKAASFAFTPLYSGYDVPWTAARGNSKLRFNGFVETTTYAYPDPGIHINTAAAISGAAVSPNMGYHSNPAAAFLLTVFSVRLGWWLRNPRVLNEHGTKLDDLDSGERVDGKPQRFRDSYPSPSPHFSLLSLVRELLGQTNDTRNYVYLSDGGHFDNMGLYELVRRRCPYIVICDSENDGDLKFAGIGMAVRKCRIDFGVEIALDLRPLEHVEGTELSSAHCVVGTIRYPEDPHMQGTVVYIKSSLTGDESGDVLNYKKEHSAFPHDATANQWFTESQFESYRRLGHHVALSVFEPAGPDRLRCTKLEERSRYFSNLRHIWCASTPEMDRFAAAHTVRYESLLAEVRNDKNLPGFFDMLFVPGTGEWKKGRSMEQIEYAVRFSSELIEFMWMIFTELNLVLPEKRNHPHARGWCLMFKEWSKVDVVCEGWKKYRETYSQRFRNFAQSAAIELPEN